MADAGVKRPRSEDALEKNGRAQIRRTEEAEELPDLPDDLDLSRQQDIHAFVGVVGAITEILEQRPFGIWARECRWRVKKVLFARLPSIITKVDRLLDPKIEALRAYMVLMDQLLQSGYAQTPLDRRLLVDMGAYRPGMHFLRLHHQENRADECDPVEKRMRAIQVQLYVYLAEYVVGAEYDVSVQKRDFWEPAGFSHVLREMPDVFVDIPDDISAEQWEMYSADMEGPLRTLTSFMIPQPEALHASSPIDTIMPFLSSVVDQIDKFDRRFGGEISSKSRGAPLEELTRISGILSMKAVATFEDPSNVKDIGRWAVACLEFLVRLLMLEVPTCVKSEAGRDGLPHDDRQQDTDWIEGLWDHCEVVIFEVALEGEARRSSAKHESLKLRFKEIMGSLFDRMAHMPLEEQRYRLECISPMVPAFVSLYWKQLRDKSVPPELANLKIVLNSVCQDGVAMGSNLLEEIAEYPCLLEFASKRALMHAACERAKLQGSAGDPIRLVVPRDNVLDGVCSSLNLQDESARIDVPLEIEFRAGYADDTGTELVDEGEDQGGLRRQWLDRASQYFISSDLFISPSEDATHLEEAGGLAASRRARGRIFVPSPETVCRCVQEDWPEQFELFGCVLGFAILYKETLPVHFGYAFLRSVFGLKTDTEELLPLLENVDKVLHTKLRYILSGSYKDLGETLTEVLEQSHLPLNFILSESHCPELVSHAPLKEGGDSISVDETNKEEFVTLLLERVLIKGVAGQVNSFRRGLLRVVPEELIQRIAELMTVKEIELMVCGADEIDVEDWEKHTNYENGYTAESQPVKWFWEVVRKLSEQQRAALLSFATGSSQVPSGGFRFLQPELFTIQRVAVTDRFPEAHTCANMVDLPEFTSLEDLERRLMFAIDEAGDTFGRR